MLEIKAIVVGICSENSPKSRFSLLEAEWKSVGGYENAEWDSFKLELAGSMDTFAKLEEAAGTMGRYYVHDA